MMIIRSLGLLVHFGLKSLAHLILTRLGLVLNVNGRPPLLMMLTHWHSPNSSLGIYDHSGDSTYIKDE